MRYNSISAMCFIIAIALAHPHESFAQTTSDNAILSAEDAFGTIVGNESLGIYSTDSVRGFSPAVAGNNRIEGVYADLLASPTGRIRSDANIRIGPAAQGYPFPAPTGIVDYTLKGQSNKRTASADIYSDSFGSYGLTLDAEIPVPSLSLKNAIGIGLARNRDSYGDTSKSITYGFVSRATFSNSLELAGFLGGRQTFGETSQPIYLASGEGSFPRASRDHFLGPDWASKQTYNSLGGMLLHGNWSDWTLKAGVFRSESGDTRSFQNLILENDANSFQRTLIAYPSSRSTSVSGEVSLSRSFQFGDVDQLITLMGRGRSTNSRFGGSTDIDLGAVSSISSRIATPLPPLIYPEQDRSKIEQYNLGVGYSAKLRTLGEISLNLQRASYKQALYPADAIASTNLDDVWIPSVNFGITLKSYLSLYGSFIRGLEDGGVAPGYAANGNQVLRAFRTRQWDGGVRIKPTAGTTIIVGYFDIRKPYITFDNNNVYRQIGVEDHKGMEASATSQIDSNLVLVFGGNIGTPRVKESANLMQLIGQLPVAQPRSQLQLNFDYSFPFAKDFSVNGALNHFSSQAASVDNQFSTQPYTTIDIGLRKKGKIYGTPYSLRFTLSNLTNVYIDVPVGDRVYIPYPRRSIGLDFIIDI